MEELAGREKLAGIRQAFGRLARAGHEGCNESHSDQGAKEHAIDPAVASSNEKLNVGNIVGGIVGHVTLNDVFYLEVCNRFGKKRLPPIRDDAQIKKKCFRIILVGATRKKYSRYFVFC